MSIARENQSDNSTVTLSPLKIIHGVVIGTNAASFLITILWLPIIIRMLFRVHSNASPAKKIAFHLGLIFLCVMLGEAIHVVLRMFIYIVFLYLDFAGDGIDACLNFKYILGYNFITNWEPYQFIYIGLSHCILLLRINFLTILFLYLIAFYQTSNLKSFRIYRIFRILTIIQALTVWVLLCIPYTAILGSFLFIISAFINCIILAVSWRILFKTISLKLLKPSRLTSIHELKRAVKWLKIGALIYLPSLYAYAVGLCLAHVAIWTTIAACNFTSFYKLDLPGFDNVFYSLEKITAILWLLDYASIIQFDIVLVTFNSTHFVYIFFSQFLCRRRDITPMSEKKPIFDDPQPGTIVKFYTGSDSIKLY